MEDIRNSIDFYLQMVDEGKTYKEREIGANNLHKKIDEIKINDYRFERVLQIIEKEYNKIEENYTYTYREQMFFHLLSIASDKIKDAIVLGKNGQVREYLSNLISISEQLVTKKIDLRIKGIIYGILRYSDRVDTAKIILKLYDENWDESLHSELYFMERTLIKLIEKENLKNFFYQVKNKHQDLCEKAPNELRTDSLERIIEHFYR